MKRTITWISTLVLLTFLLNISSNTPLIAHASSLAAPSGVIAFIQNGNIWTINANGTNPVALTTKGGYSEATWSPDGSKLAFAYFENDPQAFRGPSKIGILDPVSGTESIVVPPQLVPGWGLGKIYYYYWNPRWSPDGKTIYFISNNGTASDATVETVNVVTGIRNLGFYSLWARTLDISPTNGLIAHNEYIGYDLLMIANSNGTGDHEFMAAANIGISSVAWMHDGSLIAFNASSGPYGTGAVVYVTPGGTIQHSFPLPNGFSITTSPDGNYVAVGTNTSIYIQDSSNGTNTFLTLGTNPSWTKAKIKGVVVLLHGWQGLADKQIFCTDGITRYPDNQNFSDNTSPIPGNIADWLTKEGYEVWSAHITTGPSFTDSIENNAYCLRSQIAQVRGRAPDGKVILIAHSMGGLVARAYIENKDNGIYKNDVKVLFTVGSPHNGVPLSKILDYIKRTQLFSNINCTTQIGLCEFGPGISEFNQKYNQRNDSVAYYTIGGDLPGENATWFGRALVTIIHSANDGIVPLSSSTGLPGVRQALQTNEAHNSALGNPSYFVVPGGDLYSTSYTDCILPVLSGKPSGCFVPLLAQANTSGMNFNSSSPLQQGSLSAGGFVNYPVWLDKSGPAQFGSSWVSGSMSFTLTSPVGQTIDPIFAQSHPAEVNYKEAGPLDGIKGASYLLPNAQSGLWTVSLIASGSLPGSVNYSIFSDFESNTILSVSTNKTWYSPGENAQLSATLTNAPANPLLKAQIQFQDGTTATVNFSNSGSGSFTANYTLPPIPGYVNVTITATGDNGSGSAVEREESTGFLISPHTAEFSNLYSETLNLRSPSSYYYDSLDIHVGVNILTNGTFSLSGDLLDGNGHFVAHALSITNQTTGQKTLTLHFLGEDIFKSRNNGPYTLTNLLLEDQTAIVIPDAETNNVYQTAYYPYAKFASGDTFLPHLSR